MSPTMKDLGIDQLSHDQRLGLALEIWKSLGDAMPPVRMTPELLAWAKQSFSEAEFMEGLRDVQANGGVELCDFIEELEQAAGIHD